MTPALLSMFVAGLLIGYGAAWLSLYLVLGRNDEGD